MPRSVAFFVSLFALAACGHASRSGGEAVGEASVGSAGQVHRIPADFPTLAAAVGAAGDGDTILLAPGIHSAGVSLAGKGLVLASDAMLSGDTSVVRRTVLDGEGGDYVLFLPATDAVAEIHGLTLRNADDCIYPNAHFRLVRSVIRECTDGVDYERGSGGVVRASVFEDNRDDGIDLDEDVAVVIEESVVRNNAQDGIEIRLMPWEGETREVVIRYNHIHGNGEDGIQFIDYDGLSNRHYRVEGNHIENNAMAGIGCMDNEETNEDYRAAAIPEPIELVDNRIRGNGRDMSCGRLARGVEPSPWLQTAWAVRTDTAVALSSDRGVRVPGGAPPLPVRADAPFSLRFELEGPARRAPGARFGLQVRRNSGPWEDIRARDFPYPDEISTPRVSIVHAPGWDHGSPAGDILPGSEAPFAGGSGVDLDSLTAPGGVDRERAAEGGPVQTEWEWPVVIRRYADGAVASEAGDLFEFRMVDRVGRPVGASPARPPASVRLEIPEGLLGGTYAETPGVLGPWQVADGTLYFPMEPAETFNVLMMVKSGDFGVSWREVGGEGRPVTDDLEGFATAVHDGRIYMLHQVSEATYLHGFGTTEADLEGWVIRDELVAQHPEPPTQVAALVAHPDGRLTAFYGDSLGLRMRIRRSGGGWAPEIRVDGPEGSVASGVMAVRDGDGGIHLAYTAGDARHRDVWYRPVSSDGRPGEAIRAARGVGTTDDDIGAVAPLVHLEEAGLTVVPYRLDDGFLYTRTVQSDGSMTPAVRVSDRGVVQSGADSEQVGADAVALDGRVVVAFIDEATRDLWTATGRPGPDGVMEWDPARPLVEDINAQWVRGRVIRDATGRPVYGIVYDAGSDGGSGMNRFVALPLD